MADPTTFLIDANEVFDSMGLGASPGQGAEAAINYAIRRAQIRLEGMLKTSFDPRVVTDQFYLRGVTGAKLNGFVRLLLSNGSLRTDQPVTVYLADALNGTYTALDSTKVLVDYKRGFIQIAEEDVTEDHLRVIYTSGYVAADTTPEELLQSLLCMVPMLLMSTADAADSEKSSSSEAKKAKTFDAIAEDMMISVYGRRVGAVATPIHSTFTVYTPAP